MTLSENFAKDSVRLFELKATAEHPSFLRVGQVHRGTDELAVAPVDLSFLEEPQRARVIAELNTAVDAVVELIRQGPPEP